MKKLYFFDVDGTLIEFRKGIYDISHQLRSALKTIKERGDKYFICTGRAHGTLPDAIRTMEADGYSLCAGAFVTVDDKVLRNEHFSEETLSFMMERVMQFDVLIILECGFELYSNVFSKENGEELLKMWAIDRKYVKPLEDYRGLKVNKISITFNNLEDIKSMEDFSDRGITVLPQPTEDSFDITLSSCTKKDGVIAVKEYFKCEEETKVIAFGDSYNDIEMIEYADLGVAMGNAVDDLKKAADFVTLNVEEDGVFKGLVELGEI